MEVGQPGLQGAFAKVEEFGLSFHFSNIVKDKEGQGNDLIQYSYISLKQDALHWLKENGRLPSANIDEYFEEVKQMNEYKSENKGLKKEQAANISEISALKTKDETHIKEKADKDA